MILSLFHSLESEGYFIDDLTLKREGVGPPHITNGGGNFPNEGHSLKLTLFTVLLEIKCYPGMRGALSVEIRQGTGKSICGLPRPSFSGKIKQIKVKIIGKDLSDVIEPLFDFFALDLVLEYLLGSCIRGKYYPERMDMDCSWIIIIN